MMLDSVFGHGFTNSSIWTPEPSRRGTFGILSTCLLALGLCVWTALHLNLPEKDESRARRYLRKLSWMSLGILTPELIAFTAFQQYMAAKSLTKDMNALLANPTRFVPPIGLEGSNPSPADQEIELTNLDIEASVTPQRSWTLVHSYFVAMGGFVLEVGSQPPSSGSFLPMKASGKPRTRLTLGPDAIRYFQGNELENFVPAITRDEIQDKSKGNTFAKALACLQASWFCIQCMTRFSQGIAPSLLELNTFGHAICTLLIYAL